MDALRLDISPSQDTKQRASSLSLWPCPWLSVCLFSLISRQQAVAQTPLTPRRLCHRVAARGRALQLLLLPLLLERGLIQDIASYSNIFVFLLNTGYPPPSRLRDTRSGATALLHPCLSIPAGYDH